MSNVEGEVVTVNTVPTLTTQTVVVTDDRYARKRSHLMATLVPLLLLIGTILWLIGSALLVASQPRNRVVFLPGGAGLESGAVRWGGDFTGAWILWIIGSAIWILGAALHLLSAFRIAAATREVRQNGRRYMPGLSKWYLLASILLLLGYILVFIGSCIFSGGSLGDTGAGAILILIGFVLVTLAILILFAIAYILSTVVTWMASYRERLYTWHQAASLLPLVVQTLLYNVAAVALVVRDPPGIWLVAALLFLVGSVYGIFGWLMNMIGSRHYFAPVLGYATGGIFPGTTGQMAQHPTSQVAAVPLGERPQLQGATAATGPKISEPRDVHVGEQVAAGSAGAAAGAAAGATAATTHAHKTSTTSQSGTASGAASATSSPATSRRGSGVSQGQPSHKLSADDVVVSAPEVAAVESADKEVQPAP